jgi:predicted nucleic acid-binding protein
MSDSVFVDTNVLIYAHDVDAGRKHAVAAQLVRDLWSSREGVLSTQVLQEFYVNVTRKIPAPVSRALARELLRTYAVWRVVLIDVDDVSRASELEEEIQLSFWDALILAAAAKAGAKILLSEDLNPGQIIRGVRIENPF